MSDYLNINEAARLTGLSIPTIRSKLAKGLLPGASQVPEGKRSLWRIPRTDLIAAGLVDKASSDSKATPSGGAKADALKDLELKVKELETEIRHTLELHEQTKAELDSYKRRESILFATLETKQVQEQRRTLWQKMTNT